MSIAQSAESIQPVYTLAGRIRHSGVVMERRPLDSPWQTHAWMPLRLESAPGISEPCLLTRAGGREEWLYPELTVELFRDEAQGYYLNLTAPAPVIFVHWANEDGVVRVLGLTASYDQAARLMDGGMQVDPVPMPADWLGWIDTFVRAYYRPEAKRPRSRPPSFRGARRGADED